MSEATKTKKKLSIPVKLAIALVLGAIAGLVFKEKASYVAFIGSLFIRLLKMCVYPWCCSASSPVSQTWRTSPS